MTNQPLTPDTHEYLMLLGRESGVAYAELEQVLRGLGLAPGERLAKAWVLARFDPNLVEHIQRQLGGIVKIAQVIQQFPDAHPRPQLIQEIKHELLAQAAQNTGKFNFSITQFPNPIVSDASLLVDVKNVLREQQVSARYVKGSLFGLSAVQLHADKITAKGMELLVMQAHAKIYLAKTVTSQDFRAWAKRDFGRPKANPIRGMLPPKLAKTMITLGIAILAQKRTNTTILEHYLQAVPQDITLCDPFCGEGTILGEAMVSGLSVVGSDNDVGAIADAQANLAWLQQAVAMPQIPEGREPRVFISDIATVAQKIPPASVDLIVTEPYLGPPIKGRPQPLVAKTLAQDYQKLFTEMVREASTFLKPDGLIVVIAPEVKDLPFSRKLIHENLLDSCEKFGYTLVAGSFSYARPDAKIIRHIYCIERRT